MRSSILLLLMAISYVNVQSQIWTQDFEVNGLGTTYTSATVFTGNLNAHYNRTNGNNISNVTAPYTNKHGSFVWAGENINFTGGGGDGLTTKLITFSTINVTGLSDLEFRGLFGTGNPGSGWDYSDMLYVEYKMDANPWTRCLQFSANAALPDAGLFHDANMDGIGEGVMLTSALQQFSVSIPVTGLGLQFRIYAKCSAQSEEFAFDFLRLYSTTTSVAGCTDPAATNFNSAATTDDGSCLLPGCTDPLALNYNSAVTSDNGTCVLSVPDIIINEIHYNPNDFLNFLDASYEFVELHNNTSSAVNISGWRLSDAIDLTFPIGASIPANGFLLAVANTATYTGTFPIYPYTDNLSNSGERIRLYTNTSILVDEVSYFPDACWPSAANGMGPSLELTNYTLDNNDGSSYCTGSANNGTPGVVNSCYTAAIAGCTDNSAINYDPLANTDDGSCLIEGCICSDAANYNPSANLDDGSCIYPTAIFGCTYTTALNYNPAATADDGTCTFGTPVACPADLNNDAVIGVADLLVFISVFGTACP